MWNKDKFFENAAKRGKFFVERVFYDEFGNFKGSKAAEINTKSKINFGTWNVKDT